MGIRFHIFLTIAFGMLSAVNMGNSFQKSQDQTEKLKNLDKYWADTRLSPTELSELIQDKSCYSSEKYFLSCINSLSSVAEKLELKINYQGNLVPLENIPPLEVTEKQLLEPWRELFKQKNPEIMNIKFTSLWSHLLQQVKAEKRAYYTSIGLNGFISIFKDPHSYLIPMDYYNQVVAQADNKTSNLGFILSKTADYFFIRKVFEQSAAEKSGLKRGDLLLKINGQVVQNRSYNYINQLLKSEILSINLVVIRNGKELGISLIRSEMQLPTVIFKKLPDHPSVGHLTIHKFSKYSCDKTKEALQIAHKEKVRGLLLDLRDNSGGQIDEAACILGLFVGPDLKLFELKFLDHSKENEIYFSTERKLYHGTLAVLINRGSASASEIVAGSLQELKRALVVGERSYGKGSFQEGETWKNNSNVILFATKGYYIFPSGASPQLRGLTPDVEIKPFNDMQAREGEQYFSPLAIPTFGIVKSTQTPLLSCLNKKFHNSSEDLQLRRAQQALSCVAQKTVAGVSYVSN